VCNKCERKRKPELGLIDGSVLTFCKSQSRCFYRLYLTLVVHIFSSRPLQRMKSSRLRLISGSTKTYIFHKPFSISLGFPLYSAYLSFLSRCNSVTVCWLMDDVTGLYHTKRPMHSYHFLIYCESPSELYNSSVIHQCSLANTSRETYYRIRIT
jgi:hypothetical protein